MRLLDLLREQFVFSTSTFGPGERRAGVIDHLRKELVEVEEADEPLTEWVDVIILGMDGALRSCGDPQKVQAAILAKIEKNQLREWPDWRTMPSDKAIEHIRTDDD